MTRLHWILAVLQDLRAYASDNDLRRLEQHLGQAFEIACRDLAESDDDAGDADKEQVGQSEASAD